MRFYKIISLAALAIYFLLLLLNAQRTGDLARYVDWANVALSGNLTALRTDVVSPRGVPLTQWIHGCGFIIAFFQLALKTVCLGIVNLEPVSERVVFLSGILTAFSCYWALFTLIKHLCKNSHLYWWLLILPSILLGTQIGYYSHACSLEIFACAFVALINLWALTANAALFRNACIVGIIGSVIIIIRPYLGIFSLLACAVFLYRCKKLEPNGKRLLATCAIMITCLGIGIAQLGVINHWMTGSAFRFAYIFGDGDFMSIDMMHPQVMRTLIHPWHGLLAYHPLYAVGFAAILRLLVSNGTTKEQRLLLSGVATAIAILTLINSSWYCWWLGGATFGMRGMVATAVFIVPILVLLFQKVHARKQEFMTWWILIQFCTAWSSLLLWRGDSTFFSYQEMLQAQMEVLLSEIYQYMAPAIALGMIATYLTIRRVSQFDAAEMVCILSTSLWVGVYGVILAKPVIFSLLEDGQQVKSFAMIATIGASVTLLTGMLCARSVNITWLYRPNKCIWRIHECYVVAMFVVVSGLFIQLFIKTEVKLASGSLVNPKAYLYQAPFEVDEFAMCYEEYLQLNVYQDEKARMKRFLDMARTKYQIK